MRRQGRRLDRRPERRAGRFGIASGEQVEFSPEQVSGLIIWLDASDEETITDDGDGTVNTWADKSGNDNDFTQATSSQQPSTGVATINSLNVLTFDGSADRLLRAAFTLDQPLTIYIVAEADDTAFAGLIGTGSGSAPWLRQDTDGRMRLNAPLVNELIEASSQVLTDPFIVRGVLNGTSDSRVGVNGDTDAVGTGGVGGFIDDIVAVGSAGGAFIPWDGAIGEVLVYDSVLNSLTTDSIMGYLADKWGITLA